MAGNPYRLLYRQPDQAAGPSGVVSPGHERISVRAFYTNDAYAKEIEPLHRSLVKFGIAHETYRLKGIDSWAQAVCAKPRFILDCLRETQADGLLYTDADSSFVSAPDWKVFKDADVAWHKFRRIEDGPTEYLTGTIFVRRHLEVISFLEAWANESEKPHYLSMFTPEQESLIQVWDREGWKEKLRYVDPGPSYCFIPDPFTSKYPGVAPVIVHRQCSQKYRDEKAAKNPIAKTPETKA